MKTLSLTCRCVFCSKTQTFTPPPTEMPFHDCYVDGVPCGPMIAVKAEAK